MIPTPQMCTQPGEQVPARATVLQETGGASLVETNSFPPNAGLCPSGHSWLLARFPLPFLGPRPMWESGWASPSRCE